MRWLGSLLVAVGAVFCAVAIYAYGDQQFGRGELAERAVWQGRESNAQAQAAKRIQELQASARERERQHAQSMAAAAAQFQKELSHAKAAQDRVVADVRSGAVRLRVPVVESGCATGAVGGGGAATLGPSPARGDEGPRAELSGAASEFLVGLASEADEVVHQLRACQAIVIADRERK